jgi:hypothetical protein
MKIHPHNLIRRSDLFVAWKEAPPSWTMMGWWWYPRFQPMIVCNNKKWWYPHIFQPMILCNNKFLEESRCAHNRDIII